MDVYALKVFHASYEPCTELLLATYPLVLELSFAVIATSGYFRRGRSWGPVYSATTLEPTKIEVFAVTPMSPTISRVLRGVVVPKPTRELTVSTKRLAVPTSRFEDTLTFPVLP